MLFITLAASAQTGDVTHVHDPCIIKCGDYYYIYSTGDRIAIRRSPDLTFWHFMDKVFEDIPAWGEREVPGVSNIWAPDIFYNEGICYLYYSLSTFGSNRSCIGLATNTTLDPADPNYKWLDKGKVSDECKAKNRENGHVEIGFILDQSTFCICAIANLNKFQASSL